jgi:hypothetical protein
MRDTIPVAECYNCDSYIWDKVEAHALIDGHGALYGYHCETCAEAAFEAYVEGAWG